MGGGVVGDVVRLPGGGRDAGQAGQRVRGGEPAAGIADLARRSGTGVGVGRGTGGEGSNRERWGCTEAATRLELRANVFAAYGRTYAYKISAAVPAATIVSSDDNSFSPGTFAWPAVSVGAMDFTTWKRLTGLDGASTCSGNGC